MSETDEILKLKKLMDDGVITREEFVLKKNIILNEKYKNPKETNINVKYDKEIKSKKIKIKFIALVLFIAIVISSIVGNIKIVEENKLKERQQIEQYVSSYEEFNNIIQKCGFSYYKIERDSLLDGTEGEGTIGFRIGTGDSKISMIFVKNGGVFCVKYDANTYLYKDGILQHKVTDYILTNDEFFDLMYETKKYINSMLKSPSTAKYPSSDKWGASKSENKIIIQGYVDSQNSFGATIRSNFQATYVNKIIVSLIIDGKEYMK